jgi:recombinational DNA repair protein RecR
MKNFLLVFGGAAVIIFGLYFVLNDNVETVATNAVNNQQISTNTQIANNNEVNSETLQNTNNNVQSQTQNNFTNIITKNNNIKKTTHDYSKNE